jgi:flagellar motor protein MotB
MATGGVALLAGCGGPFRVAALDDMESARMTGAAKEGATLAPETYARGEHERDLARRSHAAGDDVGATLHAEHAAAAYGHAVVVGRRLRAVAELAEATRASDEATAEEQALEATRAQIERDAADLEARAAVARDRLLPATSAQTSPEREAARLVEARALAVEGRLLCGAAKLLAPEGDGIQAAEKDAVALADRLDRAAHPVPVDDAARARAACLAALTAARRRLGEDRGQSDALLAELSASGGWEPARDERGVYVTLRGAFRGSKVTGEARDKLHDLGQVARAHPAFALQVVVHDAAPAAPKDESDAHRAEEAVQALVAGGAPDTRIHAELAGALAPVVDPAATRDRSRNERLEVVFVGP